MPITVQHPYRQDREVDMRHSQPKTKGNPLSQKGTELLPVHDTQCMKTESLSSRLPRFLSVEKYATPPMEERRKKKKKKTTTQITNKESELEDNEEN